MSPSVRHIDGLKLRLERREPRERLHVSFLGRGRDEPIQQKKCEKVWEDVGRS